MADFRTAPTLGRLVLRLPAHTTPRPAPAAHKYARAYMLRLARRLAKRAAVRQRQPLKCPAPVLPRAVLRCPAKLATSASQSSQCGGKTGNAHTQSQALPGELSTVWGLAA
jgi:hypothetical protein